MKRYTATAQEKLWMTKAGVSRLTGIDVHKIEFVLPSGDGRVLVGLYNDNLYVSYADLKAVYSNDRKERAKTMPVARFNKFQFKVNGHDVTVTPSWQTCDCEDYKRQRQALGHGECKHIVASLNSMGYSNLASYILG